MKSFFLTLAVALSAQTASAAFCPKPEAQFRGVISEVQSTNECTFKIAFTDYAESEVCPLDVSLASSTKFSDPTCSLTVGTELSGYLIIKNGAVVID